MNKASVRLFFIALGISSALLLIFNFFFNFSANFFPLFMFSFISSLLITLASDKLYFTPLANIQQSVEHIHQGIYKNPLPLSRKDELGKLSSSLNQMSLRWQKQLLEITNDSNEVQTILSNMIEGVIVVDKNEKILTLSPPVIEMLELRSRETIGKPYWEVIRNEEINVLLEKAIQERKSAQKEISIFSLTESYFNVQVSSVLTPQGDISAVVAVFHDITELKKLAKLRSEFVANVSHELKTPLTSIIGFIETLKEGALEDKERAGKFLDIIQKHAERLEALVNDLLTLSALESKEIRLNFERTPINEIIELVTQLYRDQIDKNKHRLTLNLAGNLPLVLIDKAKIEQVFINLLDNAVKFTPPGGQISITSSQEGNFIKIDIQDSGIGIPMEHIDRIFERFYRIDKGRTRELGGTGLGLSIVKHIIQTHEGRIFVESKPDQGSLFSIFLPINFRLPS